MPNVSKLIAASIVVASIAAPDASTAQGYTPTTQLLKWCKEKGEVSFGICFGYIFATLETSTYGNPAKPDYLPAIPFTLTPNEKITIVVDYIEQDRRENLTDPAYQTVRKAFRAHFGSPQH